MFSTWTSLLGPRLLSPTAHCPLSVPTGMLYDISSATWSKANSKQGSLIIPSVLSPKPQSHPDSSFSHIPHAIHSELLLVPPPTCNHTLTTSTTSIASTLVQATVTACLLSALARFTAFSALHTGDPVRKPDTSPISCPTVLPCWYCCHLRAFAWPGPSAWKAPPQIPAWHSPSPLVGPSLTTYLKFPFLSPNSPP